MLELAPLRVSVVLCAASPEAVQAAALGDALRVAPDEVLLLGAPAAAVELQAAALERASAVDDDAMLLDATDGWTAWTLIGDAAREAFTRLSALRLPEDGFVQGDVAHVPAKIVVRADRIHVLVPAVWGAHLRERILHDCASLGPSERTEPEVWGGGKRPRRRKSS